MVPAVVKKTAPAASPCASKRARFQDALFVDESDVECCASVDTFACASTPMSRTHTYNPAGAGVSVNHVTAPLAVKRAT
jgi:hypothetical protein